MIHKIKVWCSILPQRPYILIPNDLQQKKKEGKKRQNNSNRSLINLKRDNQKTNNKTYHCK